MIYTVTFNPSLDYFVSVDELKTGEINRTSEEYVSAGGKGINVAVALKNFGAEACAIAFKAGFTGEAIEKLVKANGVKTNFIPVKGLSRINIKLKTDVETDINGRGADIAEKEIKILVKKLLSVPEGSFAVLAGSVPKALQPDVYENIMAALEEKKLQFAVDATGDLLLSSLSRRPFIVKPNETELSEIFGKALSSPQEIAPYAKELQNMGAKNVVVSMGKNGAYMLAETGETFYTLPPKGKVVDSVGAGDSLLAGFLAAWIEKKDYRYAFLRGVAAGSATAFKRGLATKEETDKLFDELLRSYSTKTN